MRFWQFTLYTLLGCLPWCLLLTWLGYLLGERWDDGRADRPAVRVGDRDRDRSRDAVWFVWHRIRAIRREEDERAAASSARTRA